VDGIILKGNILKGQCSIFKGKYTQRSIYQSGWNILNENKGNIKGVKLLYTRWDRTQGVAPPSQVQGLPQHLS
jgi:hypothetical protein